MAQFDDNEELAAFGRWWSKNGTAAIIGIVIGLLVIGGWYGWGWYSNRQDTQAADMFAQVQHGISTNNMTSGVRNIANKLKDNYSGTPYASASTLSMAAYYVDQNKLDKAAAELDWVIHNAEGDGIRQIATVRKARVLWAQKQPRQALALLDQDHPPEFDSLYAELAGDIHAAKGDRKAAHNAYKKALAKLPGDAPRQMLKQKLDQTAPVSASTDTPPDSKKSDS